MNKDFGQLRSNTRMKQKSPAEAGLLFDERRIARRDDASVERADEIALADFHAVAAQDGVGGGGMEIEIRHRVLQQVVDAGEGLGFAAYLASDGACLRAIHLRRGETVDGCNRAVDARDQIGERRFVVFPLRRFLAGQPRDGATRKIGGDVDLARKRKHVGEETRVEEHRFVDLLRRGMRGTLGEDALQVRESACEDRDGGLEHG